MDLLSILSAEANLFDSMGKFKAANRIDVILDHLVKKADYNDQLLQEIDRLCDDVDHLQDELDSAMADKNEEESGPHISNHPQIVEEANRKIHLYPKMIELLQDRIKSLRAQIIHRKPKDDKPLRYTQSIPEYIALEDEENLIGPEDPSEVLGNNRDQTVVSRPTSKARL